MSIRDSSQKNAKKRIAMILAAGMGTRMKSRAPKALQRLCNRPMITHLLTNIEGLFDEIMIVIGPQMDELAALCKDYSYIIQEERHGTGHAARLGVEALKNKDALITFFYADNPLITKETIEKILAIKEAGAHGTLLTMIPKNPSSYGRVLTDEKNHVQRIIEYKDASEEERLLPRCNAGTLCLELEDARKYLSQITPNNVQGEYYLTDIIELAAQEGIIEPLDADEDEVLGINTRAELAHAENLLQEKLRKKALEEGVTLIDPASIYLSTDTKFEEDVVIEPHVFIGLGVSLGRNVLIRSFSHLEGCRIEEDAIIGPYARLRPGTHCEKKTHVGNFVELKNTHLGEKSKVNHLSYLGDSHIEQKVNIGAGTITCNYDGVFKHKTYIEEGSFIGSNAILVAPLHIGKEALIAAGSVITKDVQEGSLVFGRAPQKEKIGRGRSYRETLKRKKEIK